MLRKFCLDPLRVCFRCTAIVLPLLALVLGGLYLKLMNSPLSVPFLVDPITRALNSELSGMQVAVEGALLQLSPRGGLEFRLTSVRVNDGHNTPVAQAAVAGIELSWRALLAGHISPARIDLIEPRMLLTRDDQGNVAISIADGGGRGAVAEPDPAPAMANPAASGPSASGPTASGPIAPDTAPSSAIHLDLARTIVQMIARARHGGEAGSHLQAIGFRDASVVIDDRGQKLVLAVPELQLGLAHKQKRSQITLDARILSGSEPWTLSVRAEEAQKSKSIPLKIKFGKLNPRDLARSLPRSLPGLMALEAVDAPVSGEASVELSGDGDLLQAGIDIAIGAGRIQTGQLQAGQLQAGQLQSGRNDDISIPVDEGRLSLQLDGQSRLLTLTSASIVSGRSRINLEGQIRPPDPPSTSRWSFDLHAQDGTLIATDPQSPPMAIEQLAARGGFSTSDGGIEFSELLFKTGGVDVSVTGKIGAETAFDGRIGPASVAALLELWPASVAPQARARAVETLVKGQIQAGSFKLSSGVAGADQRLSLSLEGTDLEIKVRNGLPPVEAPRALFRLEGSSFEVTVPEATMAGTGNRKLSLKGNRVTVIGLDQPRPMAAIATRVQGPLPVVLELAANGQFPALRDVKIPLTGIDGKADAQLKITVPLDAAATAAEAEARIEGKVRITDGRVKDIIGTHDISGATITVEAGDKGFDLKGEMLLAGVLAKINGHWLANAPDGRQPPLRITARIDNADRAQLGLDLEELIQGEVPFEVTVQRGQGDDIRVHVTGDLTSAELMLDEVQWRKPVGRPARLDFDVGKGRQGKGIELQNFKISGENIAIDGWVAMGPDNKAREYYFPDFSLNVVTNLDVRGTLRPDRVWDIKAKGKTFNGADVFRALFTFDSVPSKPPRKNKPGIEITAEVDTVLGPDDTSLRQLKLRATKRAGQFNSLDMTGILEGGAELRATLRVQPGQPRILVASTRDTGQALKLIGFYPNMIGGKGELRVNIDGNGAVEKNGTLHVRSFKILGDPVIAEVLQNGDTSDNGRPKAGAKQRIVREQFDFEDFEGVFAVGNSQLAIEKALAKGPLVGASLKGKVDFKTKRMHLGGTYVPLSGLNRILSKIPIISPIFTGPQGEGVFGITFLIEGSIADPQVIVNPLSLVAPGITREIFQMAPDNPHVTPRTEAQGKAKDTGSPQLRASPPLQGPGTMTPTDTAVGDGWSQEPLTKDAKGKKK